MELLDWHDLAIAQAGAVAALTGLVFVALSINLAQIVAYPGLVGRAAEALLLLIQPLFISFAVLVPRQSTRVVGIEVLLVGIVIAGTTIRIIVTSGRRAAQARPRREFVTRCALLGVAVVPIVVGGVVLASGDVNGMYWLTAGAVMSMTVGIADAWILLVEILR